MSQRRTTRPGVPPKSGCFLRLQVFLYRRISRRVCLTYHGSLFLSPIFRADSLDRDYPVIADSADIAHEVLEVDHPAPAEASVRLPYFAQFNIVCIIYMHRIYLLRGQLPDIRKIIGLVKLIDIIAVQYEPDIVSVNISDDLVRLTQRADSTARLFLPAVSGTSRKAPSVRQDCAAQDTL